MNDDFEEFWNEVVMVFSRLHHEICLEGPRNVRIDNIPADLQTRCLSNTSNALSLDTIARVTHYRFAGTKTLLRNMNVFALDDVVIVLVILPPGKKF